MDIETVRNIADSQPVVNLIAERSVTPCWVCGGDQEIIGPFGESLEPCPHCVLKDNIATRPVTEWLSADN